MRTWVLILSGEQGVCYCLSNLVYREQCTDVTTLLYGSEDMRADGAIQWYKPWHSVGYGTKTH